MENNGGHTHSSFSDVRVVNVSLWTSVSFWYYYEQNPYMSINVQQCNQTADWVMRNSSISTNKHTFLLKLKCQFSPAIDSDSFNQLKEAKRADVNDKLCKVIAFCEAE